MARFQNGRWSKYRKTSKRVADLEAQRQSLLRKRPRSRGKKAARTRAINKLTRKISAAKGARTKARNAISRAAAERKAAQSAARLKRSAAAKKGWTKRQAAARRTPQATISHAATSESIRRMRFLEERDGIAVRIEVVPPDRADRSAIGSYWYAVGVFRDNGSTTLLRRFDDSPRRRKPEGAPPARLAPASYRIRAARGGVSLELVPSYHSLIAPARNTRKKA